MGKKDNSARDQHSTPMLTWPHGGGTAEAKGALAIGVLLAAVFVESRLARFLAALIAAALGIISIEALISILQSAALIN